VNPPPPPPPPPPVPAKSKSRLWLILGLVLALLLVIGGAGAVVAAKFITKAIKTQENRREKLAEVEKQRRELLDAAKASVEDGTPDGTADRLAKFGETLSSAADSSMGAEKQGLRVAQRMLQSMAPAVSAYEAAFKDLQTAEVLRAETIDSRETIASRAAVVKKFGEANANLLQFINGLESRVRSELEKENFPARSREQFVTGFMQSSNVDLTREIRQCDGELTDAMQKILALLDREWGAWKVDGGVVNFNREPVIEEYNNLIGQIDELGVRQTTAQQELLKRTSKARPLR
jgi:hypothetical protein